MLLQPSREAEEVSKISHRSLLGSRNRVYSRPALSQCLINAVIVYVDLKSTSPVTRLRVQVTVAKRGEDTFRFADDTDTGKRTNGSSTSALPCYRQLRAIRDSFSLCGYL